MSLNLVTLDSCSIKKNGSDGTTAAVIVPKSRIYKKRKNVGDDDDENIEKCTHCRRTEYETANPLRLRDRDLEALEKADLSIKGRRRGIFCDTCRLYYHQQCSGLTVREYYERRQPNVEWICRTCSSASILHQQQKLIDGVKSPAAIAGYAAAEKMNSKALEGRRHGSSKKDRPHKKRAKVFFLSFFLFISLCLLLLIV